MCGGLGTRASTQLWSHAFPFVLIGAVAAAGLVRLWTRSSGAALVAFAIYLSHPLADLVTGHKPLWLGGPPIGLQLIDRPVPDFVVQSALCILGWVFYRRSLQPGVRGRLIAAAPLVMLLALQGASDLVVLARTPSGTSVTAREGDWRLATGDCRGLGTGNREPGTGNRGALPRGRRFLYYLPHARNDTRLLPPAACRLPPARLSPVAKGLTAPPPATSRTSDAPRHARAVDAPRRTCCHARCCRPCSGCDRTSGRARTTPSREVGAPARTRVT